MELLPDDLQFCTEAILQEVDGGAMLGLMTVPASYQIQNHNVENSTTCADKEMGKEGKTSPEMSGSTDFAWG